MTDGPGKHPYFGVPPAREPKPAGAVPSLQGKRVILSTPEGFVYDMRAVSQVYPDTEGRMIVDIATDENFYRWMFTHVAPPRVAYPVGLVWAE